MGFWSWLRPSAKQSPQIKTTDWQRIVGQQYREWLTRHGPGLFPNSTTRGKKISLETIVVGLKANQPVKHKPKPKSGLLTKPSSESQFIVITDEATSLWSDGMSRINQAIESNPTADIIYFDTEIAWAGGRKLLPFFKPDYSPDLLLSTPYFGSPVVIRTRLFNKLNLLDRSNPLFIWDLCLKAVEKTTHICHWPTIVARHYQSGVTASGWPTVSPVYQEQARSIVQKALKRRGLSGQVTSGPIAGTNRIIYQPDGRLVSIIISTKDRTELLSRCIEGILHNNDYHNWELIVVDNNSELPESEAYFKKLSQHRQIRVIKYPKPFNIAAIFNLAASKANGEYLCFMGNDTQPISRDWLSRMTGYMQRPEVGAVGAKLLYPNDTIQHAGVVLGYGSAPDNSDRVAGHPYSQFPIHPGYFGVIELQRNCSAVTGAVTLTRKSLYQKVGGYEAKKLRMLFNDVDYCLKIRREGYFIVYAPEVILYHHERASLGEVNVNFHMDPSEINYMRDTWHHWEDNDPFYNPNLTLDKQDYSLRLPK